MNNISNIDFACPDCGTSGSSRRIKRVCLSKNPELKESILDGSYFEWKCPGCGRRFFIDDVFLYNDDVKRFMVYLVPEYDRRILKIPTLLKTDGDYDTAHSTLRVTAGFVDFVEKIRILENGLDDRAVEAVKAVFSNVYRDSQGKNIYSMLFEEVGGGGNLRFAVFLENDDFSVDVPHAAYAKILADFSPFFTERGGKGFFAD